MYLMPIKEKNFINALFIMEEGILIKTNKIKIKVSVIHNPYKIISVKMMYDNKGIEL